MRRSIHCWLLGLLASPCLAHPRGVREFKKRVIEGHGGRRRRRLCLLLLRHCRLHRGRRRFRECQKTERIRTHRLRLRLFRGEIRFRTVGSFIRRGFERLGLLGERREKQGVGKRGAVEDGSSEQNADFPLLLLHSQIFIHIHECPYLTVTIE